MNAPLRRVLVVDDSAPMLDYLSRELAADFAVVGLVSDAESLIDRWESWRPDLIVLDVSLPGCSGIEAARQLRADHCDVPIVFLSFHDEPAVVEAAWEAGANGYVAKRDLARDLMPAIRAALAGHRFASASIELS